jgi:hypothetical protein
MPAAWQTDIEDGHEWVVNTINQTANARGWPVEWEQTGLDVAQAALPSGMSGWFADPEDYYSELTIQWSEAGIGMNPPQGWDELGTTWASAGNAAYTAAEEARLGSPVTLVTDTVTESLEQVGQAGETGLGFFSPTKGWLDPTGYKFWLPVAGIGLGCWLWKR